MYFSGILVVQIANTRINCRLGFNKLGSTYPDRPTMTVTVISESLCSFNISVIITVSRFIAVRTPLLKSLRPHCKRLNLDNYRRHRHGHITPYIMTDYNLMNLLFKFCNDCIVIWWTVYWFGRVGLPFPSLDSTMKTRIYTARVGLANIIPLTSDFFILVPWHWKCILTLSNQYSVCQITMLS